ncbi:MAG: carboxypeptidase regulatory-like domain-containing protein [Gemmatimonadetes bacterium]|nr:carboxypeptidase regulatory-like domain-containing protein [Gemmatimonadota bacterium]
MRRLLGTASAVALFLFFAAVPLQSQGVTGAAVRGTVTDDAGQPVTGALVSLVNTSTGQRYETRSVGNGGFNFENAAVGGPYTLSARSIGYQPVSRTEITLTLGQAVILPLQMTRQAVQLEAITVTGQELQNPVLSSSHTGAASIVTSDKLAGLPSLSRNFTDFIATVPQVVGTSITGQNNRFNNIQIDGGVNNDLFGLAGSGTPGGTANAKPISLEAVREYQVLIAPFDVRQGGFTGGLVNAVTKSGTNAFHGSFFTYMQDEALVGKDTAGGKIADFTNRQYGFTFSGPIVRDKAQFFVSGDFQDRGTPFSGTTIGSDTTGGKDSLNIGIRRVTAEAIAAAVQSKLGFDPGTWDRPNLNNPDRNVFAKLTAQAGSSGQVELSTNYVKANNDVLARTSVVNQSSLSSTGYQLSNSGYTIANTTSTTRAKWTAPIAGSSNELLLGYSRIRDHRETVTDIPLIFIGGDRAGTYVSVGREPSSQANVLDQDIIEVTDNLTKVFGDHRVTVGTHNEFFQFHNVFQQAKTGIWTFANLAAFNANTPNRFVRTVPVNPTLRPEGATADFKVQQLGGYLQDQWTPAAGLTLTFGVRADVPMLDQPVKNDSLQILLGIDNSAFPSGNLLWSPRVGFNYDVAQGRTVVRGGTGLFAGRPPYVWLSNAYVGTGLEQATLTCTGANVPTFTFDPASQPTTCVGSGATPPTPGIVFFDPAFKFPQNLRAALGLDQRLFAGFVGTVDFVYTKWVNQLYVTDANLNGPVGTATGEGGRTMYGTISTAGSTTTPSRRSTRFAEVLRHINKSADRSWSLTFQLQRQVGRARLNVGYTRSKTEDLISLTSSVANSNFTNAPLDGTLDNRNLRTSSFDVPHKITASGTVDIPVIDVNIGLFFQRRSGGTITYVVSNDANADGKGANDIVYVPRDAADITLNTPAQWATLDAFITSQACLNSQRGSIMVRGTCRQPWRNSLDGRLIKRIGTIRGQALELIADFINFPVFKTRQTGSGFENTNMLTLVRWDAVNNRGVYNLNLPTVSQNVINTSRWRIQLGAKYRF